MGGLADSTRRAARSAPDPITQLTVKQEKFAQLVASGYSYADAYREVYRPKAGRNPAHIYSAASRLAAHPKIKARLASLAREREEIRLLDYSTLRDRVIAGLQRESFDRSNPPGVRVRALQLLGQVVGVFEKAEAQEGEDVTRLANDTRLLREQLERIVGAKR